MRRVVLLTFAAASVATVSLAAVNPAAAAVAPGVETLRMNVRFGDLNLSSRAGARALVSRIRVAADELCGPVLVGDLGRMSDRTKCVRDAEEQAIRAVNRPTVTAAYLDLPQPDAVALTSTSR